MLIARLQARGAKGFSVDTFLREKPITIAGEKNAPPEQILGAAGDAYGLLVYRDPENSTIRLTRRSLKMPSDVTEMFIAVRRALPEPLRRAAKDDLNLAIRQAREAAKGQPDPLQRLDAVFKARYPEDSTDPKEMQRRWEEFQAAHKEAMKEVNLPDTVRVAPDKMGREAVRQFQFGSRAALARATPQQPARLSTLDTRTRTAWILLRFVEFLRTLNQQPQEASPYIQAFNDAIITGGPFLTEPSHIPSYELLLSYRDENGNMKGAAAGLIVPYPAPKP